MARAPCICAETGSKPFIIVRKEIMRARITMRRPPDRRSIQQKNGKPRQARMPVII
jgi:hypothetical protein